MKKCYLLLFVTVLFSWGAKAQTLPTISSGTTEVWYYIENGYTAKTVPNSADGRLGSFITSKGAETKASGDLIHPNVDRGSQKWKLVAVPGEADYYYLINQTGEYFYRGTDANYASTTVTGDEAKYSLVPVTGSVYFSLHRKGTAAETNVVLRNGDNAWDFDESTDAIPAVNTEYGTVSSPAAFRFVPVADIDGFYPTVYPAGTDASDITKWYYLKNTGTDNAAAPYLTYDTGFPKFPTKAKAENNDNQLFGFVATDNGGVNILVKADPTKYINAAMNAGQKTFFLEHLIAPAKSNQLQGTIRESRNGNFLMYYAMLGTSGSATNIGEDATLPTYDSYYNWAYEPAAGNVDAMATVAVANVKVYSQAGTLVVETADAQTVNVYTITGAHVYSQAVEGKITITSLSKGLYIVKVGTQACKVIL
jgi:hypothetical protein